MEGSTPPLDAQARPQRGASRSRGALLLVALALLGAGAWLTLGAGDDEADREGSAALRAAAGLGPRELADQVLLLGFEGTSSAAPFFDELRTRQLGGVIVGPQNWVDAGQGAALTAAIRDAGAEGGPIPPLIAASQEGGAYRSFTDLPPERTELEIAEAGDVAATEAWSRETGEALAGAGFDLNLFPVADVATLDSPVADRAFSDDPMFAAQLTAAAVRGCRAVRIACAALHFPGLGAASQDTSSGPATVSLDAAGLSARDLEPFRAAFAEDVPAVVLSLAFYAAYDPITPGALTEAIASGLLRDRLGFEGLAITDDLGSGAVRAGGPVADAAVAALIAGADMVQIADADDQRGVREAILAALADGRLPEDRLAEAAGRVVLLKRAQGIAEGD